MAYFSKALGIRNQKLLAYEEEFLVVMTTIENGGHTCNRVHLSFSLITKACATSVIDN